MLFPQIHMGAITTPSSGARTFGSKMDTAMQEAGVNLVSLGIFARCKQSQRPGNTHFVWLDRCINLLDAHGVRVNLATPPHRRRPGSSASTPSPCLSPPTESRCGMARAPPLLPAQRRLSRTCRRDRDRVGRARPETPPSSCGTYITRYACHVAECFCDASAAVFRVAPGTVWDAGGIQNDARALRFWSQHYSRLARNLSPRTLPTFGNPTQALDRKRFSSDSWIARFEDQRALLRRITPNVPLTTNFMRFFKPIDYWKWQRARTSSPTTIIPTCPIRRGW